MDRQAISIFNVKKVHSFLVLVLGVVAMVAPHLFEGVDMPDFFAKLLVWLEAVDYVTGSIALAIVLFLRRNPEFKLTIFGK